jgi:methionyl aminopeptidase
VTEFAQRISADEAVLARASARIAASALSLAKKLAVEGTSTEQIDSEVARYIVSRGAYPSGIGFMGFPKAICQSVNEVIAHGIPDSRPLKSGDIVNFDITAYRDGFYGDNSDMALVGEVDEEGVRLVDHTREALAEAIKVCRPGQKFSAIADVITRVASMGGFGVVDYFCGHFIGREMHIAPNIHHTRGFDVMNRLEMTPGMLFTIEPILTEGTTEADVWADGWTYVTKDNGRTAQAEHMVLITADGHEILTVPDEKF